MRNAYLTPSEFANANGIAMWLKHAVTVLNTPKPLGRDAKITASQQREILAYLVKSKFTYEQALKAQHNIERNSWANNKQFHVSDLFWDAETLPLEIAEHREKQAYTKGVKDGRAGALQAQLVKAHFEHRLDEIERMRKELAQCKHTLRELQDDREKLVAMLTATITPPTELELDKFTLAFTAVPYVEMAGL